MKIHEVVMSLIYKSLFKNSFYDTEVLIVFKIIVAQSTGEDKPQLNKLSAIYATILEAEASQSSYLLLNYSA
jgi:hypothetical protein